MKDDEKKHPPPQHPHPDKLRVGDHVVLFDNLPNDCGLDRIYAAAPDRGIEGGVLDAVFTGPQSEQRAEQHAVTRQQQSGGRFAVAKIVKVIG